MANFGDSTYEPTEEDLQALMQEAFADVGARNREALERLRVEIAALRLAAHSANARSPAEPVPPASVHPNSASK